MAQTRRELLLDALHCRPTPRTPWVPYVGCHGGKLLHLPADVYLRDPEYIATGVATAAERYRADGLPVVFDLQVEAEALGCELVWSSENPPAVNSHPLAHGLDLSDLPEITPDSGRLPVVIEAIRRARARVGDEVALFGLVTGPFTLALHLLGSDIFLEMVLNEERIHALLAYCADIAGRVGEWYREAGCDVVAAVDPMTSQISPAHFAQFIAPVAAPLWQRWAAVGATTALFVCGDAWRNVPGMCATKPDALFVDEQIDLVAMGEVARAHGVAFGGNIPLTTVLLLGNTDDARRAARQCIELGGATGYVLAPGCDMPYDTKPENVAAVAEVVHGDFTGEIAAKEAAAVTIELPDYTKPGEVLVEVVTLDSLSCAPCQYMVEAVRAVEAQFGGQVRWVEHKLKEDDTIPLMMALGVKSIPTIIIDGAVTFSSIIPEATKLRESIEARLAAKA
ncbi:MAG: thioredoxin family protein [Armatimonadetes bacterium]|nr:thioredoxin family protein [Armatimonadota bacterium]